MCRLLVAAAALALSAAACGATSGIPGDPGAGPIGGHVGPCYMAKLQHSEPCPEPPVASDTASAAERAQSHLKRAFFFTEMQEFAKALAETDAALAAEPNNAQAHHLAARLSLSRQDIDRAERDILLARKEAPNDPAIEMTYAFVLQARMADIEALKVIDKVIAKYPGDIFARLQHASLMMRFGPHEMDRSAFQAALADYNYIIERSPPDAGLFEQRAGTLAALGQDKAALADLASALKLDPGRYSALTSRVDIAATLGLNQLAVDDLDTLLHMSSGGTPLYAMIDGERAKLLVKRATALAHLRHFQDASDDAVEALGLGGIPSVLRTQVFLRANGFPDLPLDGKSSPALRQALRVCFGLDVCFQGVTRAI
jgi:tetratricopeptide (TPR) repeat protein